MKKDVLQFLISKHMLRPVMVVMFENPCAEEWLHEDIEALLDIYHQTYAYVGLPQMLKMVDRNMDLAEMFDRIITYVKESDADVIVVEACHCMFMNTTNPENPRAYNRRYYQDVLLAKVNKLGEALGNKKVIFKTSKSEHQFFIAPYVTTPVERKIKRAVI